MCGFRGEGRVKIKGGGKVHHPDVGRGTQAPLQGRAELFKAFFFFPPTVFPPLNFLLMQVKWDTHGVSAMSKYQTG